MVIVVTTKVKKTIKNNIFIDTTEFSGIFSKYSNFKIIIAAIKKILPLKTIEAAIDDE